MADDNKIKHFTAADIEKYHKGMLSSKERHDLEKAALDDPFLADAIEGFATSGINVQADIDELKKRLSEKTEKGKVIPMDTNRRSRLVLLRIAAMIVIVLGAGFLIYQFGFNNKKDNIAQNETVKNETLKTVDSEKLALPPSVENKNETNGIAIQPDKKIAAPKKEKTEPVVVTRENSGASKQKMDTVSLSFNSPEKQSLTPDISAKKDLSSAYDEKENSKNRSVAVIQNNKPKNLSEKQTIGQPTASNKNLSNADSDGIKDQLNKEQNSFASTTNPAGLVNRRNENFLRSNIFRGRVMDANNNPLPFANVTSIQDSVGAYADAKGYFNLTSPDSILNVQVQSLGFTNTVTQLRNSVPDNEVVLKEDKSLPEVVLTNKKPNTLRAKTANLKVEEPEPADGWEKYDLYLANNLKVPDIIRSKSSNGNVEVSFDVDKNGEPTNIKVEKSLCGECDKEAIRLIKEGPKWKHKSKKKRTTVTVSF